MFLTKSLADQPFKNITNICESTVLKDVPLYEKYGINKKLRIILNTAVIIVFLNAFFSFYRY